ncbi:MAG: Piwi domain-containing protein [Caldilineaceae bacterium]|nr:Piwi domain-containing protein [Caldilineaceae bacterium]
MANEERDLLQSAHGPESPHYIQNFHHEANPSQNHVPNRNERPRVQRHKQYRTQYTNSPQLTGTDRPIMQDISLNFLPFSTPKYHITVHVCPQSLTTRPHRGGTDRTLRNIEIDEERQYYWTSFEPFPESVPFTCQPLNNTYITLDAIQLALTVSCNENLNVDDFRITGKFKKRVEITTERHAVGDQVVSFQPYFLRTHKVYGLLLDFRFHPGAEHIGSREARQLSLSLDANGNANKNRYADKHEKLRQCITNFFDILFPLTLPGGDRIDIDRDFLLTTTTQLSLKTYLVGTGNKSKSQFLGVKRSGPFNEIPEIPLFCFLYRPEDRPLSHDLFRALRGDTFRTFPGMQSMFRIPFDETTVTGFPISDYNTDEINAVTERVVSQSQGANVIPVVLTPFSKHDDLADKQQYWELKHTFLSKRMPIQVVATDTVADRNILKWATSNIALQIFAKAGGTPWQVQPQTKRCLIVGIGQAHKYSNGKFSRYFAYSVLTNSSGVFETVKVLGDHHNEDRYIESFSNSLKRIFEEYSNEYTHFVVHSTFAIRRRELESIATLLADLQERHRDGYFAALKFDDRSKFFGFAEDHNSCVPYESTLLQLAYDEYLVWFEGLQYQQPSVSKLIGNPVHIRFTYPQSGLSSEVRRAFLQDAVNLSGSNWRGFNAKSLPVSVYYAKIIAWYLKEFENRGLAPIDVAHFSPWFL